MARDITHVRGRVDSSGLEVVRVDPTDLRRVAASAENHARDLSRVRTSLYCISGVGTETFASASVASAYRNFLEAWTDELSINSDALTELGRNVQRSATEFEEKDNRAGANLRGTSHSVRSNRQRPDTSP